MEVLAKRFTEALPPIWEISEVFLGESQVDLQFLVGNVDDGGNPEELVSANFSKLEEKEGFEGDYYRKKVDDELKRELLDVKINHLQESPGMYLRYFVAEDPHWDPRDISDYRYYAEIYCGLCKGIEAYLRVTILMRNPNPISLHEILNVLGKL